MLEAAVVAARIVQFLAAMMIFGTPLFLPSVTGTVTVD